MKSNEERLKELLDYLNTQSHVDPEDIPGIDLYMDQVTTFMEKHLEDTKRYPEDKVLTKTMINNYAKNNLLPPPVKKKYSKDHMLMLIFIYYFKNLLSFNDIEELFAPITSKHFSGKDSPLSLEDIYREVFTLESAQMERLKDDVMNKFSQSRDSFEGTELPQEEKDYLQLFSFICELCFDAYLKTRLVEQLIDQLRGENPPVKKK